MNTGSNKLTQLRRCSPRKMKPLNKMRLRKFDPKKISDDKVCVFIGKRNTGKSTLITDILYHKRRIPIGVIMSATEDGNHHYRNYLPDVFIHGDYNKDAIESVLARQKTLVNKGKSSSAFILLDDCVYNKKFMSDTCIRQCFMNGRHWNIFFMISMQYCMDMPPALRANVDYCFILRENILSNREKLWKSFCGIFPTLDIFNQVMDACTENFECLVVDNTSKSNSIEDCIFWYKAKVRKSFHVGSPEIWKYHRRHFNPRYEDKMLKEEDKARRNKINIQKFN